MIIDLGQNNRRYGKIVFYIPEKGMRRKGRKIFAEGKYICFAEEKQKEKIFGEGQYIFLWRKNTEKEKEENMWRGKMSR